MFVFLGRVLEVQSLFTYSDDYVYDVINDDTNTVAKYYRDEYVAGTLGVENVDCEGKSCLTVIQK